MATEFSRVTVQSNFITLTNAVLELQAAHLALQTDFNAHDHPSTTAAATIYGTFKIRINTITNSLVAGTQSSTIATTVPPNPCFPDNITGC